MDIAALIPPPEPIPAPATLFTILGGAVFAVHLLLVSALLGSALIALWRSTRPTCAGLDRQADLLPNITALGVNLAVPPLLFLQLLYGHFFYVGSTLMAVYWFGLVLAVMAAYGLAYRQKYALADGQGRGTLVWLLMSLCLVYASLVQTQVALLTIRPAAWQGYFTNPAGTLVLLGDPTFLARWLHFVLASLAMGGLVLAMIGRGAAAKGQPHGQALTAEGLAWFTWGTLATAAEGMWFLVSLPKPVMLLFMGSSAVGTLSLAVGITAAGAAFALGLSRRLMPAAGLAVVTAFAMVSVREVVRRGYLSPYFREESLPIAPETGTVVLFLACLAGTLCIIWWAVRLPAAKARAGRGQEG